MNDLSLFEPKHDKLTVELKSPKDQEVLQNADGTPMTITVWLPHSAAAKKVNYEFTDRYLADMDKGTKRTAEALDKQRLERLAKLTESWNITLDGKKPPFSIEAAISIYDRLGFVYRQVSDGIDEAVSFTQD